MPDAHLQSLRRTGRTTRMLARAAADIVAGKSVIVVVAGDSGAYTQTILALLDGVPEPSHGFGQFAVVSYEPGSIHWRDWRHLRYGLSYPVLYVDHYVLERELLKDRLYREAHRFDPAELPTPAPSPPQPTAPPKPFGSGSRRLHLPTQL